MRPASAERMDQLSRASIGHIRPVPRTIAQHSLLWRAMPQHDMLWFAYRVLRTIAPLVACYATIMTRYGSHSGLGLQLLHPFGRDVTVARRRECKEAGRFQHSHVSV